MTRVATAKGDRYNRNVYGNIPAVGLIVASCDETTIANEGYRLRGREETRGKKHIRM